MNPAGIFDCHEIRTGELANYIFIDLSSYVKPKWSVEQTHDLVTLVKSWLKKHFDFGKDVVGHIKPDVHEVRKSPEAESHTSYTLKEKN